jgi:hypothetical protein
MPFTLAHPAAAVPFTRFGFPLSALVVGSMAPDFPHFLPSFLNPKHMYGHTLPGIFWYCVPAGLAMLWLFHKVLKLPLLSLLPTTHQERLILAAGSFRFGPLLQFFRIVSALVIGAVTHIIWDSFTHLGSWPAEYALRLTGAEMFYQVVKALKILQYGSSFMGIVLLAYWYFRWEKRAPAQPVNLPYSFAEHLKLPFVILAISLSLLISFLYTLYYSETSLSLTLNWLELFARDSVTVSIRVLFVVLVVFSGIWHYRALRKTRQ